MTKSLSTIVLITSIIFGNIKAQIAKTSDLFIELKKQDSLFFELGFNNCDWVYLEKHTDENLKFYHDNGGFQDKKLFLERTKQNICGNPNQKPIRKLVENSLEVFPLYNNGQLYGAIQSGEHQFFIREKNKEDVLGGQAKFTTVWTKKDGMWMMSDILSYDHGAPKATKTENSIFENDIAIEQWLKENKIPTLGLGIIENGSLKQVKVFGEIKPGVSAPYNTIFNVASLTKPITAMVALQLASQGKWNLDEPVYHYWTDPDVANDPRSKKLTTRIILSHQTGFPNWRWMNKNNQLSFDFEPGTKYHYSGEGMEYLRKAIEKKFKKPLQEIADELIFKPLKMTDTNYIWTKDTDESRFAIGYDENGKAYETVKNKTANAADDVVTTIEDYGNFLADVMNGGHLKPEIFKEMMKPEVKTKENKYFGLGLEIYDLGNGEIALSHGGSDKGSQCIAFILPKTKQGILIFTNVDNGYKVFEKLILNYLGDSGQKIVDIETK